MFALSARSILLGALAGYFLGAIPFAYILTKRSTGLDLRTLGSRNVGATNAYEVTGKKSLGGFVFAGDFLKGLLPILIFELLGLHEAVVVLLPALVLGHCYPVWLRFHGGRGLATAAGAILLVNPAMLLLWLVTFVLVRKLRRPTPIVGGPDAHFVTIVATLACLVALIFAPAGWIQMTTLGFSGLSNSAGPLSFSVLILLLVILSRHIGPFFEIIGRSKKSGH